MSSGFSGQVLHPGDEGYDEARQVFNGMIDRRPALIARCANADDVAAAVNLAREHYLPLSVYGGGHGVTGSAVVDAGICVDLRGMTGIAVDPEARTVRAEGGLTWGELDAATQEHGLARAQARLHLRQPDRRRGCHRGRPAGHRERRRERRALLGPAKEGPPDVVKVDIEGGELRMDVDTLSRARHVFLEVHVPAFREAGTDPESYLASVAAGRPVVRLEGDAENFNVRIG